MPLTYELIRGILPKGGTFLRTINRGNPLEVRRRHQDPRAVDRLDHRHRRRRRAEDAQRLSDMGIPMVAVPKTIDNDLGEKMVAATIKDAVANPKYVDRNGEIVATARSLGISFGDGR